MKLKLKPFDHQQQFLDFSKECDYTLLGDEMGLGKTLSALSVSASMQCKTLVICPAFLRHNWRAEIEKFVEGNEGMFEVVSYSQLKKHEDKFKKAKHVIFDEAHYLCNIDSQRSFWAHNFVVNWRPERVTLLTGTAVRNRVKEFYSLLRLLSYCPSGKNGKRVTEKFRTAGQFARHFSYEEVYEIERGGRRIEIRQFKGLREDRIPELKTYFNRKYMRRKTHEVISLPELSDKFVECNYKFDDKELSNYEKFQGKIEGHIMAIKRGSAMAKANFTADYAKNMFNETGRPIVIFSDHVDPVHHIAAKLKRGAAVITGKTPMSERHTIVQMFQSGKLDYLVATIGAASTGITLTKASDLIFNDMSYVPANNAQASKRIHRIGQGKVCTIHKICGSHIDKQIMISLASKQDVIDKVL